MQSIKSNMQSPTKFDIATAGDDNDNDSSDEVASTTSQSENDTLPAKIRVAVGEASWSLQGLSLTWVFALIGAIFLAWEWPLGAAAVLTVVVLNRPKGSKPKPARSSTPAVASRQVNYQPKQSVKLPSEDQPTPTLVPSVESKKLVILQKASKPETPVPWRSTRVAAPKVTEMETPAVSRKRQQQVLNTILNTIEPPASKAATVAPWRSARAGVATTTVKSVAACKPAAKVAGPSQNMMAALKAALDAANAAKSMDDLAESDSHTAARVGTAAPVVDANAPVLTATEFRKKLVSILRELAQHRNAALAVGQVRALQVPEEMQAGEFADILTRAMEERNGPVRRVYVSFLTGLASGSPKPAFCKQRCLSGLVDFFSDVYEELAAEVPRLDKLAECELVPTLRAAFSESELETALPSSLRSRQA